VLPHQPYWEQQLPKEEPLQVIVLPQEPSVLVVWGAIDAAAAAVVVAVVAEEEEVPLFVEVLVAVGVVAKPV